MPCLIARRRQGEGGRSLSKAERSGSVRSRHSQVFYQGFRSRHSMTGEQMATRKKSTASNPTTTDAKLDELLIQEGATVSVFDEIKDLVMQLTSAGSELTATDRRLLRDIAATHVRAAEARTLAVAARDADDAMGYIKLTGIVERATSARRWLLRDLRATRQSTLINTTSASSRKLKQAAASDWTGVL